MGFGMMGKEYWQNELQKMLGIQSGATKPTDLPEYKGMANQYNAQSDKELSRIIQQMSQRGITGGAASGVIQNAQDNTNQNLLKMIQGLYQTANQRGSQAANAAIDWRKMMLNYDLANDAQKSQQQMSKMKMITDLVRGGMGMAVGGMTGMGGAGATTAGTGAAFGGGNADWYNQMYNNPQTDKYLQGW